jgi:hypothetical protein
VSDTPAHKLSLVESSQRGIDKITGFHDLFWRKPLIDRDAEAAEELGSSCSW